MALTRKMLKAMGIDEDKIEQIIDAHSETVDALKEQRDAYKEDADKLKGVQKELDDMKKDGGDWQKKYNDEHVAFEAYKNDVQSKATAEAKAKAYRKLLKDSSIGDDHIDLIMEAAKLDDMTLEEDGSFKDADKLTESIKSKYGKYVVTTTETGVKTSTPPANTGKGTGKTKDEIMAIKDGAARRQAMAENPHLFGLSDDKN